MNMDWHLLNIKKFFKYSNLALFLLLTVSVFCLAFTAPQLFQVNSQERQIQPSRYTPSSPRLEIIGLKYDLNSNGKKDISLKADRFVIRKKKMGLIRFALTQEVLFENVEISFISKDEITAEADSSNSNLPVPIKPYEAKTSDSTENDSLFSLDQIFIPADVKRVSSFVMTPIKIFFYDNDKKVSQILANRGTIQPERKEVILSGDVRMTAGEKYIVTSRLIFRLEKDEIYIPGKYLLEIRGKRKTGEPISSDIFLNSITL